MRRRFTRPAKTIVPRRRSISSTMRKMPIDASRARCSCCGARRGWSIASSIRSPTGRALRTTCAARCCRAAIIYPRSSRTRRSTSWSRSFPTTLELWSQIGRHDLIPWRRALRALEADPFEFLHPAFVDELAGRRIVLEIWRNRGEAHLHRETGNVGRYGAREQAKALDELRLLGREHHER